jgi:hypothetical protein
MLTGFGKFLVLQFHIRQSSINRTWNLVVMCCPVSSTLLDSALPYSILSCPALPTLLPCPALPALLSLPCSPCPTLPCSPCPALPALLSLPYPALLSLPCSPCPALPALPCPALHTLLSPTLPYPTFQP